MTDKKPSPLSAEKFIGALRRRSATHATRLSYAVHDAQQRFADRESAWRTTQLARVPDAERPAAVQMAQALGLAIADPEKTAAGVGDPFYVSADEVDDDLQPEPEPAAEYDDEPAGAKPYVPGPAARAARGQR